MDSKKYLDTLKSFDLRPQKIKIKEHKPVILHEEKSSIETKILTELFIKASEIENMTVGISKEVAILRLGMIAELDAINLYEQLAAIAQSENLKKILLDIAKEEKTHVGEFQALLLKTDPEQVKELEEGKKEVDELTRW